MPDNVEQIVGENANRDSLSPHGGTAGAGDSKAGKIAAIITNLTTMSDDEINGFHASLSQIGKEADGVGDDFAAKNKAANATKPSAADASMATRKLVREDLQKLFEGEESLTESFINEASILFEAAVTTRVVLETARIEEDFESRLAESTDSMVSEFADRLDTYIDYLAEQYMTENKLAIESGIKTELTEGFIAGLHTLFAEHYIDVPEDKVDVVAALAEELEETRSQLNNQINENITLTSSQEKAELGAVLAESVSGMADIDADRLHTLAEDLDYTDVDDFRSKVNLLRERFFDSKPAANSTGLVIEEVGLIEDQAPSQEDVVSGDPRMAAYVSQIKADARK